MTTETTTFEIETARPVRAFSCGYTRRFAVDSDGTVRAWDSVAGHYTLCHSLTTRQQAAIRRQARASLAAAE